MQTNQNFSDSILGIKNWVNLIRKMNYIIQIQKFFCNLVLKGLTLIIVLMTQLPLSDIANYYLHQLQNIMHRFYVFHHTIR